MRLVEFTDYSGYTLMINPEHVTHVYPSHIEYFDEDNRRGTGTQIYTVSGTLTVRESLKLVIHKLGGV